MSGISEITLPDTSLCAIVRDEKENPAGGIERFVKSIINYVEAGVIVDCGSKDGTREILNDLASQYPKLKIFDTKFNGYDNARNFALDRVETKMALVLDADELLTGDDFEKLKKFMEDNPDFLGYNFRCIYIYPEEEEFGPIHNPRLFTVSKEIRYKGFTGEELYLKDEEMCKINGKTIDTNIIIKHFCPRKEARLKKYEYYSKILSHKHGNSQIDIPPSEFPGFKEWKAYNPKRDSYL